MCGKAEERNVAILFFKPVRKLLDPNEDLLTIILLSAITQVNKEVAMAVEATEGRN